MTHLREVRHHVYGLAWYSWTSLEVPLTRGHWGSNDRSSSAGFRLVRRSA